MYICDNLTCNEQQIMMNMREREGRETMMAEMMTIVMNVECDERNFSTLAQNTQYE